jgi:hypothetical protein
MATTTTSTATESRFEHLRARITERAEQIDLRARIATHPLSTIGIAFAAGAIIGLIRQVPERGRVSTALRAAAGAIALRLAREVVAYQLGDVARRWWQGEDSSKMAEIEPFLEH